MQRGLASTASKKHKICTCRHSISDENYMDNSWQFVFSVYMNYHIIDHELQIDVLKFMDNYMVIRVPPPVYIHVNQRIAKAPRTV